METGAFVRKDEVLDLLDELDESIHWQVDEVGEDALGEAEALFALKTLSALRGMVRRLSTYCFTGSGGVERVRGRKR